MIYSGFPLFEFEKIKIQKFKGKNNTNNVWICNQSCPSGRDYNIIDALTQQSSTADQVTQQSGPSRQSSIAHPKLPQSKVRLGTDQYCFFCN